MRNFNSFIINLMFPGWINNCRALKARAVGSIFKITVSFLTFFLIAGCYYYKVNTVIHPLSESIASIQNTGKVFVVHSGERVIVIDSLSLGNDSIAGIYIQDYILPYRYYTFPIANSSNRYWRNRGDTPMLNEVHFYLRNVKTIPKSGIPFSFAVADIDRLDVYKNDTGRTALSWIFGFIGGFFAAWAAFIAVLIGIAFLGGSCPYIYVNTGNGFDFAGEIYSGAIYAPLERNDYLVLPQLVAENGKYLLKMSNEQQQEVQHTNLMELLVFDHPLNSKVLVDKCGNFQTAFEMISPLSATNFGGTDILDFVKHKDSVSYCGTPPGSEIPLTDGVIMSFKYPEGINSGKLFIRARNSIWLDNVFKEFFGLLGNYQDDWIKRKNKSDSKELLEWSLDQKIPLSVYIERNGMWEFCDYFNIAGPMALKEDVLALDLKGIRDSTLNIKLESGSYFWEIDYAGIDFSTNVPVKITKISADVAVSDNGVNVSDLLNQDDSKYYIQSETGNLAELSFSVPDCTDVERTVILHSKGYYHMILETKGLPHLAKLNTFRKPGKFPEFSRELMKSAFEDLNDKGVLGIFAESSKNK
jgi:hypothetical protein